MAMISEFLGEITGFGYAVAFLDESFKKIMAALSETYGEPYSEDKLGPLFEMMANSAQDLPDLLETEGGYTYKGIALFSSNREEIGEEEIRRLAPLWKELFDEIYSITAGKEVEKEEKQITWLDEESPLRQENLEYARIKTASVLESIRQKPNQEADTLATKTQGFEEFSKRISELYERAYQDQIELDVPEDWFVAGLRVQMPWLMDLPSPLKEQRMIKYLLADRSHVINRLGTYSKVSDALSAWIKTEPLPNEDLVNQIYNLIIEGRTEAGRSAVYIDSDPVLEAGSVIPHYLEPADEQGALMELMRNMEQYYAADFQAKTSEDSLIKLQSDLNLLGTKQNEVPVGTKTESMTFMEYAADKYPAAKRRYQDLLQNVNNTLKSSKVSKKDSKEVLEASLFRDGSITFIDHLDEEINLASAVKFGGTFDYALPHRLASILRVLCQDYKKSLQREEKQESSRSVLPQTVVAVVDQFPSTEEGVQLFLDASESEPAYSDFHGNTVASLVQAIGGDRVGVKKYYLSAKVNSSKECLKALAQDEDVQVVNFSSSLSMYGSEAAMKPVFQEFWDLCQKKDVIVALGNDNSALTAQNTVVLKNNRNEKGSGYPIEFLRGFTNWMKNSGKTPEDIASLKLVLCENYRMNVDSSSESSSTLLPGHPLASNVVGVRADCIISMIPGRGVESGTSYGTPMIAGALASSSDRDTFRQLLLPGNDTRRIVSWESLSIEARQGSQVSAVSIAEEEKEVEEEVEEESPFAEAASSEVRQVSGLGPDISSGAAKPQLSAHDQDQLEEVRRNMRQLIPSPGSSSSIKVK